MAFRKLILPSWVRDRVNRDERQRRHEQAAPMFAPPRDQRRRMRTVTLGGRTAQQRAFMGIVSAPQRRILKRIGQQRAAEHRRRRAAA